MSTTGSLTELPLLSLLPGAEAETYASWFATLADPTRLRLLHLVATTPGSATVGGLAATLGISQSTCSHHVRKLAGVGFVVLSKEGTTTRVTVNAACCTGLPHAADVVMGVLAPRPCCPDDVPADVTVRPLAGDDWDAVRRIYAEGIATGNATFEPEVPSRMALEASWLAEHRWVAELDGQVVGWTAASRVSSRPHEAGVAEALVFAGKGFRGRGVGKALLHKLVVAADSSELWTLQAGVFPENRAGLGLLHSAGFRTLGVRERFAQQDGAWRDVVFLERRRASD